MKKLFALQQDGKFLFSYKTNQGNVKKAFFTNKKLAETAYKNYIEQGFSTKEYKLEIVEIGEVLE